MKLAPLRLLVVEDHDFQRHALVTMLARLGIADVLQAADGESALELLAQSQRPVDIIISDIDMPGMDGIEFIRRVGDSGHQVSIVAVSAIEDSLLASVQSMAAAYGITLLGVLTKPLSQARLLTVLERHQPRGQAAAAAPAKPLEFTVDEIRRGLAAGEFTPVFQPKVAFDSGRVHSFEALARWRHPQAGLVAPQAFLQRMEDAGLVDELTFRMLEQAAACCAQWRAQDLDLCVSVNLSVKSLADVQLADRVAALVQRQGLETRHVILELTESAAASGNLGPVLENLARLRLKGFGLSIDDFGTGYASVQQLGRIAFTELKIDKSFVHNSTRGDADMVLLQSSLDIARKLKLVSVAEGIETAAEWDLLRRLGCDLAQGYFIARPMEPAQVLPWLRERTQRAPAKPCSS